MQTGETINSTIKLAGREFEMRGETLTAAQEIFMQGLLRASGVTAILAQDGARIDTHGEEILTALLLSGRAHLIVAGMLCEVGKRWTRDGAIANAEAFADMTDGKEKETLHAILFGVVAGFFEQGGKSLLISRSFSPNGADAAATPQDGVSAAPVTLVTLPS